jgi:hypothetical protein
MGALKLGDLRKPDALKMGTYGSTYKHTPGQVKSTMDNKKFTQDYFNLGVKAPLMRAYEEDILPQLKDNAASAGNTFSTRTAVAKQKALEGLQTEMAARLSGAVREDEIERSRQSLESQQFNVQSGMQNAQFGAGQDLAYAGLNSQNALSQYGLNSQNALNWDSLNTSRAVQSYSQSAQNKLAYDQLNTQTKMSLGENAINRRMQGAALAQDIANQPLQRAGMKQQLVAPVQNWRQQNINADYNEFMRTDPANNPWIKLGLGIAGLNPNAYVAQQRGPMDYALGGLGIANAGLGLYNGINNMGGGGQIALPSAYGTQSQQSDATMSSGGYSASGYGNTVSTGPTAMQQAGQYAGYAATAMSILSML